jgi:4-amino-4-deoxy-L-arabinose transferase-like glycosyltransferase
VALTLNLAGNDRVGLWDRDEPRYATCTREMRAAQEWIRPTFNAQPRYHKPVLIYWLMRAGYAVGGDNPFGARLISALAGAATCMLVGRIGRSMYTPRVGWLAGLALATVPIMVAESKLATTDATLALLVVVAQGCLWELTRRDSPGLAYGFWLAMALATLLKGPVGPVFVAAAALANGWWGGSMVAWRRLRWGTGLPLFLAVTAPWFVAVGLASRGEFFRFALKTQILQRVSSGMEQHSGFPGYYALLSLPFFYPWSALLPAAVWAAWSRRRVRAESAFLLGWVVGPWMVLECFGTKLIHYYLPAFPACALLVAALLVELDDRDIGVRSLKLGSLGVRLLGILAIGGTVALAAAGIGVPALRWPLLAMASVLGLGMALARSWLSQAATWPAARLMVATWAVVMGLFSAWFLPAAEPYRVSRLVGERLGELANSCQVRPAMMTFQEPGLVYAIGRPVCDVEGVDELAVEVLERGPVVAPLLPEDLERMEVDARFRLRKLGSVSGFNVNKGRMQTLEFAIIEPGRSSVARSGQDPLVK